MIIKSPRFSFVEFDVNNAVCGGSNNYLLPATDLGIKFQIKIESLTLTSNKLYVGICNADCETIVDEDIEVERILTDYKFLQTPEPDTTFSICDAHEHEVIESINFDKTPYFEIPEGTDIKIDIPPLPIGVPTPRSNFIITTPETLTVQAVTFIFVICDDANPATASTMYYEVGNRTVIIRIKYSANANTMRSNIIYALNDYNPAVLIGKFKDAIGRTAVNTGTQVIIPNVPKGVGFNYENMNANIAQPVISNSDKKYFIYDLVWWDITKRMYWLNFHRYYGYEGEGNNGYFSINHIDLRGKEGQLLEFRMYYRNRHTSNIKLKIAIKDNGSYLAPEATYYMNANSNGIIQHTILAPPHYGSLNKPFDQLGQITIIIEDTESPPEDRLSAHDFIFDFDNITLESINVINVVSSVSGPGYLAIPVGIYTRDEFYEYISEQMNYIIDSCSFTTCEYLTLPKIQFVHETGINQSTSIKKSYTVTFDRYWNAGMVYYPDNAIPENLNCFKYCIIDDTKEVITCSNTFKRETDDCFTTVLEYYNNENAFGFVYQNSETSNIIRLPMYLHSAGYPTEEKIYKSADGNYRRVSAQIEKEYEAITDNLPEWLHDKLIVALKHDIIKLTSDRIKVDNEEMMQQGNYDVDWKNSTDLKAMAKFKVRKVFDGINSNCNDNNTCI